MQASNDPHYHWWQAPLTSFYNKNFYVDVARNWQGAGIGYLFFISVLATIIGAVPWAVLCYKGYYDPTLPVFYTQVPKVTFADGHVTIDKPCPYQIKDPNTGTIIAEFRTNQSGPPKLSDTGTNPPIIITHDYAFIDSPSTNGTTGGAQNLPLSSIPKVWDGISFNGSDLYHFWQTMMVWIPLLALLAGIPATFIGYFFQALVYGLVAQLMAHFQDVSITYGTGMRLAVMAITPCVVINSLLILLALAAPMLSTLQAAMTLLSVPIAISVLFVAALALKQSAQAAPVVPTAEI